MKQPLYTRIFFTITCIGRERFLLISLLALMAACCTFPDIFSWVQNLPPINEWRKNSMSQCICSSSSSTQPSLNLSIAKNNQSPSLSFAVNADFNLSISLWTSKPFKLSSKSRKLIDEDTLSNLLVNFVEDVLQYGSNNNNNSFLKFPKLDSISHFKDMFNFAFVTLLFLICIYEAPADLRSGCLDTLKNQLANCQSRQSSKLLMKFLGSNLEEQWMRSINLSITNLIIELQNTHHFLKTPSPLFSYSLSTFGLWKIHLYCPVISMDIESSSNPSVDERLQFSLTYHQLEGVVQFNYKVVIQERWVEVIVNTDNIRYDDFRCIFQFMVETAKLLSLEFRPSTQSCYC